MCFVFSCITVLSNDGLDQRKGRERGERRDEERRRLETK